MPAEIRSNGGSFTAKWRRYEHLTPTTTPLAEITGSVAFPTRTAVQPSVTDITATVSKYGNFIFLNEEVQLINITDTTMELTGVLGENAGRSVNRLQRNEMEDNSTAILAGAATTATNIGLTSATGFVTRTVLARTINELARQDAMKFHPETTGSQNIGTAPVRESYWGLNHSDTTEDVRNLTGFQSVETYAGQTRTYPGEYGHVGGVRFIESTESTIDAAGGASSTSSATSDARSSSNRVDIYNTVIFGKEAVGSLGLDATHIKEIYRPEDTLPAIMMISHAKGSAGAADPLNEVASCGWKTWHAAKILNANWIRCVRHAVSRLS
jgi:N4-gp56 family major capsid protein